MSNLIAQKWHLVYDFHKKYITYLWILFFIPSKYAFGKYICISLFQLFSIHIVASVTTILSRLKSLVSFLEEDNLSFSKCLANYTKMFSIFCDKLKTWRNNLDSSNIVLGNHLFWTEHFKLWLIIYIKYKSLYKLYINSFIKSIWLEIKSIL